MKTQPLVTAALLLLVLATILTTSGHARELDRAQLKRVQPFDEWAHLPPSPGRDDQQSQLEPGLGNVLQLDTYIRPKSSQTMGTSFHVYRVGRVTYDIKFRGKVPGEGRAALGTPLDPAQDYQYNLEMMLESGLDSSQKTVVMIPGYLSDHEEQWARDAMHAWLELYGNNIQVVVVSWADSNRCLYSQAVATTPLVARQVTVFLHYLAQLGGTNLRNQTFLDRLHLIGHSLGAHISGFVGQDLAGRLGRITGLDPAGPSFDLYPTSQRLDRADARLVEVLHTNAGRMRYMKAISGLFKRALSSIMSESTISAGSGTGSGSGSATSSQADANDDSTAWFGIDQQVGHIDYWANNGRTQEGCRGSLHICDHGRAGDIYVDALKYEAHLKTHSLSGSGPGARHLTRLWAFRAPTFDSFQAGSSFLGLCPELVQLATTTRGDTNQTAAAAAAASSSGRDQSFARCAAPLLDFMTPVEKLIGELRDTFHINFDSQATSEAQPRFYFRTSPPPGRHLVADHYLLKIHLDPLATRWDPRECPLSARLHMPDGAEVHFELRDLEPAHAGLLAPPFAHPLGPEAHLRYQELLTQLPLVATAAAATNNSQEAATQSAALKFARSFAELFPRTLSLGFATLAQSSEAVDSAAAAGEQAAQNCQVAIKLVEVHPVSVYSPSHLGALYGGRPLLPGIQLELVNPSELAHRLASTTPTILSFGHMNSLGMSLESAIVEK